MSRSTRSSTRVREGKSPARKEARSPSRVKITADPIADSVTTINGLIESFVNSATEVEMNIFSEMSDLSKQDQHILLFIGTNKGGFEKLCSRISQINNKHKNCQLLMKAEKVWRQLMQDNPISLLLKLDVKKRREVCSAGRDIASSLFITGNIYSGLAILKEIIEMNDYDPQASVVLLRWLVRYSEWEAMEKFLESDRKRKKSNFEGFEELVQLCVDILDFHRFPKGREEKVMKMMELSDKLNKTKDKTFQVYEAQILLYNVFSVASKVAGIKQENMLDPLYCMEQAYLRAETVVKSRWTTFAFDKKLDGLKTKSNNSVEYLKTASAVAEYFDILRLNVNEYVRCAILREPVQYATIGLCHAIKLGFAMWITETLTLLLSTRLRSEADKDELTVAKRWINSFFCEETEQKEKEGVTCMTQMVDHLNKLTLFSDQSPHIPCVSSTCGCYLCLESCFNPSFSFFCSKLTLLCSGHSTDSINNLVCNYDRIRSAFAPLQKKLMNVTADKPRPPSWICDEMGESIVSFLLSATGLSLPRKDSNRVKLLTVGDKICSYSTHLCLSYRLILRNLTRHPRESPSFPWMNRKSIMTKLADLSMGSEGRGRRTPSRSPFTPLSLNTTNRSKTTRDRDTEKEDKEEKNEYEVYGHLLYHDWRSRTCEQLCLKSADPWTRAMFLSESVAVGTREARRHMNGNIKPFGFHRVKDFKGAVEMMPPDMTVNQLIVSMSGDLYFIKMHSRAVPIVVPLAREGKWSLIMDGFARAMAKSDETAQAGKDNKDPKLYWEGRRKAEELMRRAMVDMESDLLGAFAPLLLPPRTLTDTGKSMVTRVSKVGEGGVRSDLGREMVAIAAQTTPSQYKQLVECMSQLEKWSPLQVEALLSLQKSMEKGASRKWIEPIKDLPFVFFVLSTELSRSPWEAVSVLEGKAHSSRLVSIHQLFSLLNSFHKVPYSANPLSSFYILDPGNDLAATKTRLTPVVESVPSWKGVTGKAPDKNQVSSIISENDFFIFLGHGNGLRYLSRTAIRKTRCKAVVLLMGCSSVHTIHEGRGMDGKGAVLDYSVASCPCIVGCIYMVTDGEIDRYFTAFVNEGLARHLKEKDSTPVSELRLHLEAMAKARTKVKLPYLTGSTVVSYGIPIDIRVQSIA